MMRDDGTRPVRVEIIDQIAFNVPPDRLTARSYRSPELFPFFTSYVAMPALLGGTKGQDQRPSNVSSYFREVFRNPVEAIQTQLNQIGPRDGPLTRAWQCMEILLAHGNADTG